MRERTRSIACCNRRSGLCRRGGQHPGNNGGDGQADQRQGPQATLPTQWAAVGTRSEHWQDLQRSDAAPSWCPRGHTAGWPPRPNRLWPTSAAQVMRVNGWDRSGMGTENGGPYR